MYNNNQFYNNRPPFYVQQNYPQQPAELPISDIRFLTADQIKGFIPPINSKVLLIDRDNSMAFLETTDNMGNMYKQAYSFSIANAEPKEQANEYATKQELEALKKEIENLRKLKVEGGNGRNNNNEIKN